MTVNHPASTLNVNYKDPMDLQVDLFRGIPSALFCLN